MTIEKKTFVDQVMVDENGNVHIRWKKALVEDGKVLAHQYHRTLAEPGDDIDKVLKRVEDHLEQMGEARPAMSERDLPRQIAAAAHTPDKIAKRRAREVAAKQFIEKKPDGE